MKSPVLFTENDPCENILISAHSIRNTLFISYFIVPEKIVAVVSNCVCSDALAAVAMKNTGFWNVTALISDISRGPWYLHLQILSFVKDNSQPL
jgi:hypothetical protein